MQAGKSYLQRLTACPEINSNTESLKAECVMSGNHDRKSESYANGLCNASG